MDPTGGAQGPRRPHTPEAHQERPAASPTDLGAKVVRRIVGAGCAITMGVAPVRMQRAASGSSRYHRPRHRRPPRPATVATSTPAATSSHTTRAARAGTAPTGPDPACPANRFCGECSLKVITAPSPPGAPPPRRARATRHRQRPHARTSTRPLWRRRLHTTTRTHDPGIIIAPTPHPCRACTTTRPGSLDGSQGAALPPVAPLPFAPDVAGPGRIHHLASQVRRILSELVPAATTPLSVIARKAPSFRARRKSGMLGL